ncbi:MAG: polysaccharide pyruvyl transferase family protein [Pseudomonadota bacterium]|nr:polysaccharide pyruvyl transferase family protein [Pseudomonadota bacterium]
MIQVAIINDTRPTHHYGCMLVMENLTRLLSEKGVEVVWTWPVGIDWRKHKSKIEKHPKVDAIIVNGEGTIHHSADRKHARALAEFASFANNELKTPSYLINATLYENEASLYENLKAYRAIYVRDNGSLKELKSFGLSGTYVPDLTFAKAGSYQRNPIKKGCVIDTALKSEIPALKQYCHENEFDFRSMVVARASNANFFKSPRPFVKNIAKWLTHDRHVSTKPSAFINYLNEYEVVVTGRYHTVTMCLKNKIPFVALESNTPKITWVLEACLGSVDRVMSFDDFKRIKDLKSFINYSDEELALLNVFIKNAEVAIYQMIESVVEDIKFSIELNTD